MKKSTLLMTLALILSITLGIGGTMAYLQDTDEDVNVMTLGNVHIKQIELERVKQTNSGEDELQDYTQGKPLYPAVGAPDWPDANQKWPFVSETANSPLFDVNKLKNVNDKFVFVENTGKSDAYVRTIFAFEIGSFDPKDVYDDVLIHLNNNDKNTSETEKGHWNWKWIKTPVEIDGSNYAIAEAIYLHKNSDQGTPKEGILPAGATSYPSLLQVYLDPTATNETMEAIDGNGNGTYDILVVSQAVQTMGFTNAQEALDAAFGDITAKNNPWVKDGEQIEGTPAFPIVVTNAEELQDILAENTDAKSGDVVVNIINDIDASDVEWSPIKVDGYNGAGVITVKGNGNTISNLTAPLFAGGFAGKSGIVIENLTIADSDIVSKNTLGSGAFIESVDSMQKIVLDNCHLVDSTVTGGNGSRTGGLLGWTAGYNNVNNGPVKTYVTIEDCSVINCTIESNGSVGGIYGHAGNNAWTYSTVKNCTVKGCTLNSTDDGGWRVGVVVGTANVGEMTIENITESGNTLTQTDKTAPVGQSNLYGRFVPGDTGKLVIDGVAIQ